jgi:MPBQ/MSBQ methyltransferase
LCIALHPKLSIMDTRNTTQVLSHRHTANITPEKYHENIQEYYDVAGPDYEVWSKNFNMHFGYVRSFTDIFSLEKMLVNMNREVIKGLNINEAEGCHIADLGCGVGTVARYTANKYPRAKITGVTISKFQVDNAQVLIDKEMLRERVSVLDQNFEDLGFPDETFTHAYAIESACHAAGANKELFIAEMARTLKTGGQFCVADGFLKPARKRPALFRYLSKKIIKFWAVPEFAHITEFERSLKAHGFTDVSIREISWHIAPSVLYVPWICIKFFFKEIWRNKTLRMKKERWNNVYAPLLGMILGLHRKHFGYFIITGKKTKVD